MNIEIQIHNDGSVTLIADNETRVLDADEFLLDVPKPIMDGYHYGFRITNLEIAQWFYTKLRST